MKIPAPLERDGGLKKAGVISSLDSDDFYFGDVDEKDDEYSEKSSNKSDFENYGSQNKMSAEEFYSGEVLKKEEKKIESEVRKESKKKRESRGRPSVPNKRNQSDKGRSAKKKEIKNAKIPFKPKYPSPEKRNVADLPKRNNDQKNENQWEQNQINQYQKQRENVRKSEIRSSSNNQRASPSNNRSMNSKIYPQTANKEKKRKSFRDAFRMHYHHRRSDGGTSIRKIEFSRQVKSVFQEIVTSRFTNRSEYKWSSNAIFLLQNQTELQLVRLFENANLSAKHAKRVTLMKKDLELVHKITEID